jgi:hypothetical protein
MKRKLLLFSLLSLFLTQVAMAQNIIKGVVKDIKGLGIPGVTVKVLNTAKATITDFNGKYSIATPTDASLSFSSLGYTSQTITVNGKTQADIVLQEDSKTLGEVVVTAIGIKQQKKKLGYATQEVKNGCLVGIENNEYRKCFIRTGCRTNSKQPYWYVSAAFLFFKR